MLSSVAKRQIKRYGKKGDAVLNRNAGAYNSATMENVVTPTPISLLAYVGVTSLDQDNNSTKWSSSTKVLIALDSDFDGVISQKDTITVNTVEHDIEKIKKIFVNDILAYIRVMCRA